MSEPLPETIPIIVPIMWGKGRIRDSKIFRTKTTEAVVRQQNANTEEKKTVKTRIEFPETWLWQTIKIK